MVKLILVIIMVGVFIYVMSDTDQPLLSCNGKLVYDYIDAGSLVLDEHTNIVYLSDNCRVIH